MPYELGQIRTDRGQFLDKGNAVYNVCHPDFGSGGAKGDGVTDDTAAIQAAIEAAQESGKGGVVFFPAGTYVCASSLDLVNANSVRLEGVSAPYGIGIPSTGASLLFTQSGSGNLIDARSSYGLHFKNLRIAYNHASFTGTILNLDGSAGYDTSYALVERCEFEGASSVIANAAACVSLSQAIICTVRDCLFTYAEGGILGKRVAGYSNAIQVISCTFHQLGSWGIKNAAEAWLIQGCTFEPAIDGGALGYTEDLTFTAFGPVVFDTCWFGDASAAERPWILYRGNNLVVRGCMIATAGTGMEMIRLDSTDGAMENILIESSTFEVGGLKTVGANSIFSLTVRNLQCFAGGDPLDDDAGTVVSYVRYNAGTAKTILPSEGGNAGGLELDGAILLAHLTTIPTSEPKCVVGRMNGVSGYDSGGLAIIPSSTSGVIAPVVIFSGDTTPVETIRAENAVAIRVPGVEIGDGFLLANQFTMWLNEAGNALTFKVKYAGGTVKSGTVALT